MRERDSSNLIAAAWRLTIERGLSREEVARLLGISESRIDRIINAVENRRRKTGEGAAKDAKTESHRPCVVLLEDDPLAAEVTERVLRDYGADAEFVHATDMDEYLDALEQCPVEVVISDSSVVNLPPLTAAQMAKRFHPGAGFIILSGRIDPDQLEKALASGVTMAVKKENVRDIVPQVLKILSAAAAKPWLS